MPLNVSNEDALANFFCCAIQTTGKWMKNNSARVNAFHFLYFITSFDMLHFKNKQRTQSITVPSTFYGQRKPRDNLLKIIYFAIHYYLCIALLNVIVIFSLCPPTPTPKSICFVRYGYFAVHNGLTWCEMRQTQFRLKCYRMMWCDARYWNHCFAFRWKISICK